MLSSRSKIFLAAAALTAVLSSASGARAGDEEVVPQVPKPVKAFPWFVGIGAGVSYPTISGPQMVSGGTVAPTFTLHGGYTVGDHLNLGFELSGTETNLGRDTPADLFKLGYKPTAACQECPPKIPGGDVIATSLVFSTFGARAEYAPFSRDGLFVGGTAGVAFLVGLESQAGFGFGGRVGYRFRPTNIMTVSVEAGMQGQLYGDTTMYMPFGTATVRPYF